MRTNVAPPALPHTGGRVMEVTESFECYVEVGITESNTYFGSSQALGRVWQRFTLVPGDQIAAYWSGLVHILVGEYLRPAQYTLSAKHPFEKEYGGGPIDTWPLDKLVDIDLPPVEGRRAENTHFEWADLERAGGSIYGYGIDWVLPENATIAI